MKSIAIIGTSPIMLILAYEIKKKSLGDVTIIDYSNKIGGAWSNINFNSNSISTQTNVIVPDNKEEEENIPKLNTYLNNTFNIKIKENKDKFEPLGYLAKKITTMI